MFRITESKQVQPFPPRPGGIPPRTETVAEADELDDAIVAACAHPTLANSVALGRLCDRLEDLFLAAVTRENKARDAIAKSQPDLIARGVDALRDTNALNAVCDVMDPPSETLRACFPTLWGTLDPPATDDDDSDDGAPVDPDGTDPFGDADDAIEVFMDSK